MSFLQSRSRVAAVAAAIATIIALPLAAATPAAAHDELLGSTPLADEALAEAPERVSLTFSDDVLTLGAVILVVDGDETNWVEGETTLDGSDVTAALQPSMPDGAYEVRWRVVSSDGHPIAGVVPFTVGEVPAEPAPDSSADDAETPSDEGSTPSTEIAVPGDATRSEGESADVWRTVLIAGGGAALAVVIWLIFLAFRRRRTHATTSAADSLPEDNTPKGS